MLLIASSMAFAAASPVRFDIGTAITDPEIILELNRQFGVRTIFGGWAASENLMYNEQLFLAPGARLPVTDRSQQWKPVDLTKMKNFIVSKITEYKTRDIEVFDLVTKVGHEKLPANVMDERFFGRIGRFELVAIVNRMDKAFKVPESCGEIRFIYRLFYEGKLERDHTLVRSRLPMTLNLVLTARAPEDKATCKDIAQKWLQPGPANETSKAAADRLVSVKGPLGNLRRSQLLRLEMNVQILRASASSVQDFGTRAEYVLAVFDFDAGKNTVVAADHLENQIDGRALTANADLRKQLVDWLVNADNLRKVDAGTALLPREFLVKGDAASLAFAVSVSPGGEARSINQPLFGALDNSAVSRLEQAVNDINASGTPLLRIKSMDALSVAINDLGCTGCHQTRSIAGFHLPGADWRYLRKVDQVNAVSVPGSPHFFADVPRRRAILEAFRDSRQPDFRIDFSARPIAPTDATFQDTELLGGWGATCYAQPSGAGLPPPDPSFSEWKCKPELVCSIVNETSARSNFGVCINKGDDAKIGDPLQRWKIDYSAGFDRDRAKLLQQRHDPGPPGKFKLAHQEFDPDTLEGGFPNGMLRGADCKLSANPAKNVGLNTVCTPIADKGFNECLKQNSFETCIDHCTKPGVLRTCSDRQPCRDDYICMKTAGNVGACIPPYFVFQFRVDRHPKKINAIASSENVPQNPSSVTPPECVRD
ncbi:MAG TPA: hypothetical protein VGO49_09915 [Bradyrhizobium sp.]|nr:hypothetical protein [Bradyrhizobium sp.]